jgi:hypothetical protein
VARASRSLAAACLMRVRPWPSRMSSPCLTLVGGRGWPGAGPGIDTAFGGRASHEKTLCCNLPTHWYHLFPNGLLCAAAGASGIGVCRILRRISEEEAAAAANHGVNLAWPPARSGATFTECGPGQLLLCGGSSADSKPFNDAWILDVAGLTWRCVFAGHTDFVAATGAGRLTRLGWRRMSGA